MTIYHYLYQTYKLLRVYENIVFIDEITIILVKNDFLRLNFRALK
jgi:hypothetical protein